MTAVMQGVRVLEVAEHTFVPAASALLADWGAEVIGQGAGPVAVPVEDGHGAARIDEATDRRLTQATGAAGDQC
jgi:hypothetical protein